MHGTEGQGRGAKQVEEYNKTYTFDKSGSSAGQISIGYIITHDDTWTNVAWGHMLQDFRYYNDQLTKWGTANGESVYDLNAPNGTIECWATGTHTGPNNASSPEDTNPNKIWWDEAGMKHTGAWPANRWWVPGVVFIVRNMTQAAVGPMETPKPGYQPYTYPHPLATNLQRLRIPILWVSNFVCPESQVLVGLHSEWYPAGNV